MLDEKEGRKENNRARKAQTIWPLFDVLLRSKDAISTAVVESERPNHSVSGPRLGKFEYLVLMNKRWGHLCSSLIALRSEVIAFCI